MTRLDAFNFVDVALIKIDVEVTRKQSYVAQRKLSGMIARLSSWKSRSDIILAGFTASERCSNAWTTWRQRLIVESCVTWSTSKPRTAMSSLMRATLIISSSSIRLVQAVCFQLKNLANHHPYTCNP